MTDADDCTAVEDTAFMIRIQPGSPSLPRAPHSEGSCFQCGTTEDRIVSDGGRAEAATRTRDISWVRRRICHSRTNDSSRSGVCWERNAYKDAASQ